MMLEPCLLEPIMKVFNDAFGLKKQQTGRNSKYYLLIATGGVERERKRE